jgi:hypothetical protein
MNKRAVIKQIIARLTEELGIYFRTCSGRMSVRMADILR